MVLAGQKGWLYLLVGVWAYYHVIRQHYGFMVLYKVKNRDLRPLDNTLDRLFLGVTTVFPPFHRFFIHHPEELGMPFSFPRWKSPFWILVAATCLVWPRGNGSDGAPAIRSICPSSCCSRAVIPLHWLTFAYLSWQAAVPTVTIVHNLQYHALVWFHNRNRYAGDRALRTDPGGCQPESAGLCRRRPRVQLAVSHPGLPTRARCPTSRSASFAASA